MRGDKVRGGERGERRKEERGGEERRKGSEGSKVEV